MTPRSTVRTSTPRTRPGTQGDLSNCTKPGEEPPDHAIGRSGGGLSTKIHHLCDWNLRPLVMLLLGPGQGGDSPMFEHVLGALEVSRLGPERARTTPVRAIADKAYSSTAIRALLRRRGIQAVIPERADQIAKEIGAPRHLLAVPRGCCCGGAGLSGSVWLFAPSR